MSKGLIPGQGEPWLLHQLRSFAGSGGRRALVVLGHQSESYFERMPWLRPAVPVWSRAEWVEGLEVRVALNPKPEWGPFHSVQIALRALAGFEGCFVQPVDVPLPAAAVLEALADPGRTRDKWASIPHIKEAGGGHPVWISKAAWPGLIERDPEDSESRLDLWLRRNPSRVVRIPTEDVRVRENRNFLNQFN